MKILKSLVLLLLCTLLYPGQEWPSLSTDYVTVWIHGTKLTPTVICAHFFYRLAGMNAAEKYDKKYHKRGLAELLCGVAPQHYCFDSFYFFGWNGKLCFIEREKASQDLFEALMKLTADYEEKYGKKPKIRIVTHSHGGNVVLNLALNERIADIVIDELILLGCPVQEKTKHFIECNSFKKIYSFYSGTDLFQIIDPQGLYKDSSTKKTFSERRFNDHDKVRQARIKLNGRSLMHIDFLCFHFLKHLPLLCQEIDTFYTTIIPTQIHYEKVMDIRITKDDIVQLNKTLKRIK